MQNNSHIPHYRARSTISVQYQASNKQNFHQQRQQTYIPQHVNYQPPTLRHAYSQNTNQPIQINSIGSQSQNVQKKIDNYTYNTKDEVGLGFASHVFKDQRVAIKVMNMNKIEDDLSKKLVNEEIAILERIKELHNQNLLRLQGVFKTQNHLYIVSEYCQGKDMAKVLRLKKQLSQVEAQSVMKQILKGYAQIYQLGIVHRDLKLSNILIQKGIAKIADFGFAVSVQQCNQKFTYNVGSPYYMPPQALKYNKYSFKSDVWSFGVMAYEMVHGYVPWKDKVQSVLYDKIASSKIYSLIDPSLKLSDSYKEFIYRCLTFNYDARATPETIIYWKWDLAAPYVEGIEQQPDAPKQPPQSYIKSRKVMHAISMDQQGNAIDLKDKQGIFESGKAHLFKKASLNGVTTLINTQIKFITKKQQVNTSPFAIQQKLFGEALCSKFLLQLRDQINKNYKPPMIWSHKINSFQLPPQGFLADLQLIKNSITFKKCKKFNDLSQTIKTNENILKIAGFEEYSHTPAWQKQKVILLKQFNIINEQLKQSNCPLVPSDFETLSSKLKAIIYQLRQTLTKDKLNLRWLELLTAYYHYLTLQRDGKEQKVAKVDLKQGDIEKLKAKWTNLGL